MVSIAAFQAVDPGSIPGRRRFFQAEDGIRDCLLSRGLGDVYKRQVPNIVCLPFSYLRNISYFFKIFELVNEQTSMILKIGPKIIL